MRALFVLLAWAVSSLACAQEWPTKTVRLLPFDHVKDFAPVSLTGTFPNLLVVNNGFPVKSVPELISILKANPGKFSFASSGQGTSLHLSGEMFKQMTQTQMLHIPYKGGGPAVADVIAGVVQMTFGNLREAMATDEMKEKYATGGSRAISSTPAEFAAFIREDTERWAPVIRASGARVE